MLLNGEGGIGKTTLAATYFHTYQEEYHHLCWLFTGESLQSALLSMAPYLGLAFDPKMSQEGRVEILFEAIRNLSVPCLLIIDNANEVGELDAHYQVLSKLPNFHILITSRLNKLRSLPIYQVKTLSEEKARSLFLEYYPFLGAGEGEMLTAIFKAINYNTLVIELLAKNLSKLNELEDTYTLKNLLLDLQSRNLLRLSHSDQVETDYVLEKQTPEEIIKGMYDLVDLSRGQQKLLAIFSVLPAEKIPYKVLKELVPDLEVIKKDLISLAEEGWLDFEKVERSFKVSPVIQEVVIEKHEHLYEDCEGLISELENLLDYELGINHFKNVSYEDAALFTRYGETIIQTLNQGSYAEASLCINLGTYFQSSGDLSMGLRWFEQCRIICEHIKTNTDQDIRTLLGIAYQKIGIIYGSFGKLEQSLNNFEKFSELLKTLYEENTSDPIAKNGLAISYSKLGFTHSRLGDLEKALGYFEVATELSESLYSSYPENVSFNNSLAISYERLGETHSSLGNLEKAKGYFEEATELFELLYSSYPENVRFKNGLAISYSKLGETHSSLGNLEEVWGYFEKFSVLIKELYSSYPENVEFKNNLAISYSKLGFTHSRLGNLEKTLGYFEEFTALMKDLYSTYPKNVSFKNGLAVSYSKLGETHSSLGNLEKALGYFEEATELSKSLYSSYPENVEFKKNLATSYSKLGKTHRSLENLEKALGYFEEFTALMKDLYSSYPENVSVKNGLVLSYSWLGYHLEEMEREGEAKERYKSGIVLAKELVERHPEFNKFHKHLKWLEDKLK